MHYQLDFFSQYGQFYIADKDAEHGGADPNFWSPEAFSNRLAVDEGFWGVSIENDECMAKVEVSVLEERPTVDESDNPDHSIEVSIALKSGFLHILDCPSSGVELELPLPAGDYRLRICSYDLDFAYDIAPKDHYRILIWKEAFSAKTLLKQWVSYY